MRGEITPKVRSICEPWTHPLLGYLSSRIVMSAMTRSSAGPAYVATPAMAAYYAKRARHGVGLILTESTAISPEAAGFPAEPRIHTLAQVDSWRTVTKAVHEAGAPISCQLIHCGRTSHADYTDGPSW